MLWVVCTGGVSTVEQMEHLLLPRLCRSLFRECKYEFPRKSIATMRHFPAELLPYLFLTYLPKLYLANNVSPDPLNDSRGECPTWFSTSWRHWCRARATPTFSQPENLFGRYLLHVLVAFPAVICICGASLILLVSGICLCLEYSFLMLCSQQYC